MNTIILDFETSGLNSYHCDVIEIGAKHCESNETFTLLVKPKSDKPISPKITEITGITNNDLCDAPNWENAYHEFYNWLHEKLFDSQNNYIISHNGTTFDFIILKRIFKDIHRDISQYNLQYIDTLLFSRRLLPIRSYYSQSSLCRTYNIIEECAHRALADVICLEKLFNALVHIYKNSYNKADYNDIINFISYQ